MLAVGVSATSTSRLRNHYVEGETTTLKAKRDARGTAARGGRRRQNFAVERKAKLLASILECAETGGVLLVGPPKAAIGQTLGRAIALATAPRIASPRVAQAGP